MKGQRWQIIALATLAQLATGLVGVPATRAVRISRAGFSISMMSTEANSLSEQLTLRTGSRVDCTLEHTRLCLRRCDSTRDVPSGTRVPCLALTNIGVPVEHRRKGHARRAVRALVDVAAKQSTALIVENVVSPHMHALCTEMGAEPLWGSRSGANGANYWLPPKRGARWADLAV